MNPLEFQSPQKQKIDDRLMASLDKVRTADEQQWFPTADNNPKAKTPPAHVQPPAHTITPSVPKLTPTPTPPASTKSQPIPIPTPSTEKETAPSIAPIGATLSTPPLTKHPHRYYILFLPFVGMLALVGLSLAAKIARSPLLPIGVEIALYFLFALLEAISFFALTLYYLGELREDTTPQNPDQPTSAGRISKKSFAFIAWPIFVTLLLGTLFVLFPADEMMLGNINGLSAILLLTGPLALTLGILLIVVLKIYKNTLLVPYPSFIHIMIDFVWQKLR